MPPQHGHWMNLSTCLTSSLLPNMTSPLTSHLPSAALRSLWKTCGLFDTCGTGVTGDLLNDTSADLLKETTTSKLSATLSDNALSDDDVLTSDDMEDLLRVLGKEPLGANFPQDDLNTSWLSTVNGEGATSLGQDSFCEAFTDISDYLLSEMETAAVASMQATTPTATCPVAMDVGAPATTAAVVIKAEEVRAVKRSITEAFGMEECTPSVPNHDHDDYVLKDKRRRTVESSTLPPSKSDLGTSTEATLTSDVDSKVDRQVQRRIKNNIASKRSRETRKQRYVDMEKQADQLERDNETLKLKVAQLEKLTKEMKATLIGVMAARK